MVMLLTVIEDRFLTSVPVSIFHVIKLIMSVTNIEWLQLILTKIEIPKIAS